MVCGLHFPCILDRSAMAQVDGGLVPWASSERELPLEADQMTTQTVRQEFTFQAEIKQLLHLLSHSLVSEPGDRRSRADLECVGCTRQDEVRVADR